MSQSNDASPEQRRILSSACLEMIDMIAMMWRAKRHRVSRTDIARYLNMRVDDFVPRWEALCARILPYAGSQAVCMPSWYKLLANGEQLNGLDPTILLEYDMAHNFASIPETIKVPGWQARMAKERSNGLDKRDYRAYMAKKKRGNRDPNCPSSEPCN